MSRNANEWKSVNQRTKKAYFVFNICILTSLCGTRGTEKTRKNSSMACNGEYFQFRRDEFNKS